MTDKEREVALSDNHKKKSFLWFLLNRVGALIIIIIWGFPWAFSGIVFSYGLLINSSLSTSEGEVLSRLVLVTVFGSIALISLSTSFFFLYLFALSGMNSTEKRKWARRFMFSYITAIPKFWHEYIWKRI